MKLMELLKKNRLIRSFGKKANIFRAFVHDELDFCKYYLESAEKNKDYKYSIMLLVHSLEKGMCMDNIRPFGYGKVKELLSILAQYENEDDFEYKLGVSILDAWLKCFRDNKWDMNPVYKQVAEFMCDKKALMEAGCREYSYTPCKLDREAFSTAVGSRHSVRKFMNKELNLADLDMAIDCFIETPTACNRQMCRLLYVKDQTLKQALSKVVIGLPGFDISSTNFFVVTYDLAAFAYSGERQQGLFNAGLCTMNFVNALHVSGIGSCCLQWSNKYSEDKLIREKLGLGKSERIAVVIGAGYYMENNLIPSSVRKPKKQQFKLV